MEFLEVALPHIAFTLKKNQRLAIAGETGSGKSTLLKIIAGLAAPKAVPQSPSAANSPEANSANPKPAPANSPATTPSNPQSSPAANSPATTHAVFFESTRVLTPLERLIPGQPGIAYLSQDFPLWHNYRVSEVLDYNNDLDPADAATLYRLCHIDHLLGRRTDQLSGGERQRIALARLLVHPPRLLLLDEPFSNLDMIHKRTLKSVLKGIAEKYAITLILVSHDPYDTLTWADLLIVLKDGGLVQSGSPRDVYEHPIDEYVAGLLGDYTLANGGFIRPEAQTAFFFSTHP
jgi:iron(III) transport system ATP-binding protein